MKMKIRQVLKRIDHGTGRENLKCVRGAAGSVLSYYRVICNADAQIIGSSNLHTSRGVPKTEIDSFF